MQTDFAAVTGLETIHVPSQPGSPGGRCKEDDPGVIEGNLHSHVGYDVGSDDLRQLSNTDRTNARAPALDSHRAAVAGDAATAALGWSEGSPIEDWGDPRFDHFLVFGDERVVRPRVYLQSEVEWDCEEQQQRLLRAKGGN